MSVDGKKHVTEGTLLHFYGRQTCDPLESRPFGSIYKKKFLTARNILCGNSSNKLKNRLSNLHICINRPIDRFNLTKRMSVSYIHVVLVVANKHV